MLLCGNEKKKVYSIFPSVEKMDNDLWGVFECKVFEDLDSYELEALRSELSGQASDGWGEGFEQRPISTSGGDILVSFWNGDNECWQLIHEDEFVGEFPEPDEDIDDNIIMGGM